MGGEVSNVIITMPPRCLVGEYEDGLVGLKSVNIRIPTHLFFPNSCLYCINPCNLYKNFINRDEI